MRALFACSFLAMALMDPLAARGQAEGRPPEQKEEPQPVGGAAKGIRKDQADAILNELRQIRQLLERQQVQLPRAIAPQAAAPAAPQKVNANIGNGSHSIGRTDAPVTLIEFADFQCPYCRRFHINAFAELKKNYIDTGKVRFISRDLPLEFHPYALKAAEAARCAGDQQKYWEMRDALFANDAIPNDDAINKAAESLYLDLNILQICLSAEKYKAEVQKDATEAATLHIDGTPSFVLGKTSGDKLEGVVLVGARPYSSFDAAIQQILNGNAAAPNGKGN
jgi:protein-disulfide isomerase